MIVDGGAHDVSEHLPPTDEPPVVEDLNLLVQRAREGDETVLPQLREMLDTRAELWKYFGNIAAHAKETWLRVISGVDLALKECTARKAEDLVRELAGPAPTAIERLLAERAALCWLQIHHADALAAQSLSQSRQHADFWEKRQAGAHRRYLTSLAALVTLRRLLPGQTGGRVIDSTNSDTSSKNVESSDTQPVEHEHQLRVVGEPTLVADELSTRVVIAHGAGPTNEPSTGR
jgi:hypothetical protein